MDGGTASEGEHMDIDRPSSPVQQPSSSSEQPDSLNGVRAVRGTSVDMLAQQPYLTSGDPSPKSSHSDGASESTAITSSNSIESADKEMDDAAAVPPLNDQVRTIYSKVMANPEDGQVGYLVSTKWLERVMARCEEGEQYGPHDKTATEGEIGPVDNTLILPAGKHHTLPLMRITLLTN
jgi:ubiquitin carboxyl-terminal hydrolase 4/11/15